MAVAVLASLLPSWSVAAVLLSYLGYLAAAGSVLRGKLVAGAVLPDSSRLHYRCNGLFSLLLLLGLSALGIYMGWMSPTVVAYRGIELLSATFIFSVILNLTPSCNHSIITVGGNTDVELFWSAKDLMSVSLAETNENKGAPNQIVYRVEALKRQPFSDKIIIVLPTTGQTEEVEVGYDTGDKTEPSPSSGLTTLAVILTCIVVPLATIALFMKLLEKPVRQAPSRHAEPTPTASPGSMPSPGSPSNGQFSPRTPQPFMEYVRKTVDDTPYYKRDSRRRFNPQNTY